MIFTQTTLAETPRRLVAVHFALGADWTKNDVNYWTVKTWLRRGEEPIGRLLGTVPLRTRSIAAQAEILVWPPNADLAYIDVAPEDSLVTIVERTESPPALVAPRMIYTWPTR